MSEKSKYSSRLNCENKNGKGSVFSLVMGIYPILTAEDKELFQWYMENKQELTKAHRKPVATCQYATN